MSKSGIGRSELIIMDFIYNTQTKNKQNFIQFFLTFLKLLVKNTTRKKCLVEIGGIGYMCKYWSKNTRRVKKFKHCTKAVLLMFLA